MPFQHKRLVGPTVLTTSSVLAYTVPANKTSIIKQVVVTNTTASAATFTLRIGVNDAIFNAVSVAANDTMLINLSQVLAAGETLYAVASANSTLNLTISGIENDGPIEPTETYIADGSVTSAKIADGTIMNSDINASAAIDKTKIAGTAITAADTGTVTSTMILNGTIATTDIANNAITQAKLDTAIPLSGMRNRVINGAMVINQRGASSQTGNTNYLVDRWRIYSGNVICGLYTSTDAPAGFRNSIYAQCNTAPGNSSYNGIVHQIEGYNIADLGFGTASPSSFTVSFWVKSSKTGVANFSLANSNNTRVYVTEYTINAINTWEYKTLTITADTTNTGWDSTNGMGLRLWWDLGSDASYNATANTWVGADRIRTTGQTLNITSTSQANLFLTGVQVEKSTQATPFEQRSYGLELALCQRYYETSNGVVQVVGGATGFGGNTYFDSVFYKVEKRIALNLVTNSTSNGVRLFATDGGADYITMWKAATQYYSINEGFEVYTTHAFSVCTTGGQTDAGLGRFYWNANAEF